MWYRLLINPRIAKRILGAKAFRAFATKGTRLGARTRLTKMKFDHAVKKYGPAMETMISEYPQLKNDFSDIYKKFKTTQQEFDELKSDKSAKNKALSLGRLVVKLRDLSEKMNMNVSQVMRYKKMINNRQYA